MASSQGPSQPLRGARSSDFIPEGGPAITNKGGIPDLNVKNRELGSLTELDQSTLDANFSYRWVYKAPLKVARMKARGYEIVKPDVEPDILNAVGESPTVVDGTYSVADVILMRLPKLEHRARRKQQKRKTDKRLKGPERRFRKTVAEHSARRGQRIEVITDKDPEKENDDE